MNVAQVVPTLACMHCAGGLTHLAVEQLSQLVQVGARGLAGASGDNSRLRVGRVCCSSKAWEGLLGPRGNDRQGVRLPLSKGDNSGNALYKIIVVL